MIQFLVIVWGSADPLAENNTKKILMSCLMQKRDRNQRLSRAKWPDKDVSEQSQLLDRNLH